MLTVLLLLSVALGLLEGLDEESGSRGDNRDGGLTVDNRQLDGTTETLELRGVLGTVIGNLLGRQTEGTDLGGKGRGTGSLTTETTEVDW